MKAVLVIDMPKSCGECPLHYFKQGDYCMGNLIEDDTKCPLKPMPKKWVAQMNGLSVAQQVANWNFQEGWNACLDEITGETE